MTARVTTRKTRPRKTMPAAPTAARVATFDRRTTETDIRGRLTIDGEGRYTVSTGIRF